MALNVDKDAFLASLGGAEAVGRMSDEARADALEDYSIEALDDAAMNALSTVPERYPTAAEVAAAEVAAAATRTLKARAFDITRYLLPLATNTSLGEIVNARTLESHTQLRKNIVKEALVARVVGEPAHKVAVRMRGDGIDV